MDSSDSIASSNEKAWDALVKAKQSFTVPWLDLDPNLLRQYAEGKLKPDKKLGLYLPR